jgi:glutamine synthetase adenylyltransferase
MLERIRRDRGSGSDLLDFKTGTGGIIEAEFLVHALQMKAGIWETNLTSAMEKLRERGLLTAAESSDAKRGYEFLRGFESVLRRWANKSVSTLPGQPDEQKKLSHRLGYDNFDTFRNEYLDARNRIHALYGRHIKISLE